MNLLCEKFKIFLDSKDIRYSEHKENDARLRISFGGGDFSFDSLVIHVDFAPDDDGHRVKLVAYPISFNKEQAVKAMVLCNHCNDEYKFLRFSIDDENDLCIDVDSLISPELCDEPLADIVFMFAGIYDKVYKDFMRIKLDLI